MQLFSHTRNIRPTYYLLRPWLYVRDVYRNAKMFIHRGRYGWAPEDTWGLCSYLAGVMSETILDLKKNHCGYPPTITEKKWDKELLLMAQRFAAYDDIDEIWFSAGSSESKMADYKKRLAEFNKVWKQMETYFPNLWD